MNSTRILRIGIASDIEIRARTIAIAKGDLQPLETDPKVWLRSLKELHTLLSDENKALIDAMRSAPGSTVSELAEALGRKQPSISRSLKKLSNIGLVELKKVSRAVVPDLKFDRVELAL